MSASRHQDDRRHLRLPDHPIGDHRLTSLYIIQIMTSLHELQSIILSYDYYPDLWYKALCDQDVDFVESKGEGLFIVSDFFAMLPDGQEPRRHPFELVVEYINDRSENFINQ